MQFHFLWVLCGQQYPKAGIIWEEHETQRGERRTLGEGGVREGRRPHRGSLPEGREGWWNGILCVRPFHSWSYRKGSVVPLQGGEWRWGREMAERHKQRPGEIGPWYKALLSFRTDSSVPPLLCTSTCNLWGLAHKCSSRRKEWVTLKIVSEWSLLFFCSNVTSRRPYAAIQKSISGIAESGTSLTYFYQGGEASDS